MSHASYCNVENSKYFMPSFDGKHDVIERIKEESADRRDHDGSVLTRPVSMVYRTLKGRSNAAADFMLDAFAAMTGENTYGSHHWAIKVGDRFFELTLHPTEEERELMREAHAQTSGKNSKSAAETDERTDENIENSNSESFVGEDKTTKGDEKEVDSKSSAEAVKKPTDANHDEILETYAEDDKEIEQDKGNGKLENYFEAIEDEKQNEEIGDPQSYAEAVKEGNEEADESDPAGLSSTQSAEEQIDTRSRTEVQCWRCKDWQSEAIGQIEHEDALGETRMNDEEIVAIGNHYIACWRQQYSLVFSNCQTIAFAVLGDILEQNERIYKQRSGYKMIEGATWPIRGTLRTMHRARGLPTDLIDKYDDAFVEYIMFCNDITSSNHFAGLLTLTRAAKKVSPEEVQEMTNRQATNRLIHDSYLIHALLTFFPYITKNDSGEPCIMSMHNESQALNNRLYIPILFVSYWGAALSTNFDIGVGELLNFNKMVIQPSRKAFFSRAFKRAYMALPGANGVKDFITASREETEDEQGKPRKREILTSTISGFWNGDRSFEDSLTDFKSQMETSGYWEKEDIDWHEYEDEYAELPQWMQARAGRYLLKLVFVIFWFMYCAAPFLY